MNKLPLSKAIIADSRRLACEIANDVQAFINRHTTDSVERATLRLLGIDGVDEFDVPIPNRIVDACKQANVLARGVSMILAEALAATKLSLFELITRHLETEFPITGYPTLSAKEASSILRPYVKKQLDQIQSNKTDRAKAILTYGEAKTQLYVIVATGNIYEDVHQAKAAAQSGANIIAVIRTTGQSLLDYVPYGPTTEGFGGTYATQANFQIMRKALDEVGAKFGRYIKLVNYASGLCMPEIAAMAAMERLDVLLNDSMYGIIFRDINMQRTFVDQYFSRRLNAFAGIIINTGEDNYLTTSDAFEEAHTVLASQFINEQFAYLAGLPAKLMGLGHAFEIDPNVENSFLYELAQAQMAREIFPDAPLKYMPPTKHINGNIFRAHQQNALFNIVTQMTGQSIHLLGMMTEAIHTPFLSDRHMAIQNMKMVQTSMASIQDEIQFKPDGLIERRATEVLSKANSLLAKIHQDGLFHSLELGVFAGIKRPFEGGKGRSGVFLKANDYFNIALAEMEAEDEH
jgi:beta-lysine 5,6-aminomutase alpha subunit